ncbi:hypothetical protein D3C87_504880 [compost metagenome]
MMHGGAKMSILERVNEYLPGLSEPSPIKFASLVFTDGEGVTYSLGCRTFLHELRGTPALMKTALAAIISDRMNPFEILDVLKAQGYDARIDQNYDQYQAALDLYQKEAQSCMQRFIADLVIELGLDGLPDNAGERVVAESWNAMRDAGLAAVVELAESMADAIRPLITNFRQS